MPTGNWNTKSDENHEIFFNFERWKEEASSLPMTKRSLLGLTAKIFDPLGYLAPLTIPMKVLFHVLCTNKVDWGEELTGGLLKKFQAVIRDIKLLHSVRTLRCYFDPRSKPINVELHGFSDASIHAYSAVVYLKSAYENGTVQVRLVASKTRVAPLKPLMVETTKHSSSRASRGPHQPSVLRFIKLLKSKISRGPQENLNEDVKDLNTAEVLWIRATQISCFPEEINLLSDARKDTTGSRDSEIIQFGLYLDEAGVLRGREIVKKLIRHCVVCRKYGGTPFKSQPTPDLPDFRVILPSPTLGWISRVRFSSSRCLTPKQQKTASLTSTLKPTVRSLVFTCASTRSVHIELTLGLSVQAFLLAFRRGLPATITSDNAKTFKSAKKDIKRIIRSEEVRQYLVEKRVEWNFIVERAPWWGGFWERLVVSVKRPLKRIVGRSTLTLTCDQAYK